MLYLTQPAEEAAHGSLRRIALAERTAIRLERALLTCDLAARRRELLITLADDREISGWAMRAAELRLGRTINRVEEAAEWLCDCIETALAASLVGDESLAESGGVEWRLLALASRLSTCKRELDDFHGRLEREKIEALKELAYGASHEINNPLANIASRAQTLLDEEHNPERRRKLATIHRQAMRAHEMIADLMLFARPPKLNRSPCDVTQLLRRVVDEHRDMACECGVELACELGDERIDALADETQLGVALHAIVKNALEALTGGGHVWVTARSVEQGAAHWAEVAVRDDGPGISDAVRQHMFDPFFSGREAGRGLGFGLSKAWRIITDHGGQVVVQRPFGRGAEISIRLPLAAPAAIES